MAALSPQTALADEGGVSFWLPGLFGSLAAVPLTPGWSLASIYYHTSVSAAGNVAAAKEIEIGRFSPTVNVNLNVNLNAQADLLTACSDLHLRDARAGWTVCRQHDGCIRPKQRRP